MVKTILITGSTDGIGLATAKRLAAEGHVVLLHGRNASRLEQAADAVTNVSPGTVTETYLADLSRMANVEALAKAVSARHARLDVLINNAGIFKTGNTRTRDGLDVRFAVNTLAPYLLTKRLLPLLDTKGRVVNLSSAAPGTCRPGSTGRAGNACRYGCLCPEQTGNHGLVTLDGAIARRGTCDHCGQSRFIARQQDGQRGFWCGRGRYRHRCEYPAARGPRRRVRFRLRSVFRQ